MTRVILYSKPDCELCEEARALLDEVGATYEIRTDARFGERVPVVEVDGRVVSEGRVRERAIRRALRTSG